MVRSQDRDGYPGRTSCKKPSGDGGQGDSEAGVCLFFPALPLLLTYSEVCVFPTHGVWESVLLSASLSF